jgi:hypothetical protein
MIDKTMCEVLLLMKNKNILQTTDVLQNHVKMVGHVP